MSEAGGQSLPEARDQGSSGAGAAFPARALANALLGLKVVGVTDRSLYDGVLCDVLVNHPRYLGVWSVWEPNALDGRDAAFANSRGHDETGRFVPLWSRGSGRITVEPNSAYDTGEWYVAPMTKGHEVVLDPYDYPMAGAHRLITTQVAPITWRGARVGVAGIDFEVARIPAAACEGPHHENEVERLLARAFVFLDQGRAGARTRVSWSSARGQHLLRRFFGEAPRESELPRRLRRLLDERDWPEGGAGEALVVPAQERGPTEGDTVLRLRPFFHHDTGPGLLLEARAANDSVDDDAQASGRAASRGRSALSAREDEVLSWMSEGKTNAEIGEILDISLHTVKRHVERILQKLAVPNRSAAIAQRLGASALGRKTYWESGPPPLT